MILSPFAQLKPFLSTARFKVIDLALFFCNSDQTPITVYQFNIELQRCLQYCGLDISHYKNHSFRIGGACHAADKGFSDAQIQALGRWKSDAFKVYLRSESINAN